MRADRLEADAALAELCAGEDFSLEFVALAERAGVRRRRSFGRGGPGIPVVGVGGKLASEQNFDATVEEIAGCGIARTDRLSANALAAGRRAGRGRRGCC